VEFGLALVTVGHLTIITAPSSPSCSAWGRTTASLPPHVSQRSAGQASLCEAIGPHRLILYSGADAGGASLLIFGALATVDFPGFAELGIVAAKGVLMILISTWMVQPALYALLPPKLKDIPSPSTPLVPAGVGKYSGTFPNPVAVILVILAIGCAIFGGVKVLLSLRLRLLPCC